MPWQEAYLPILIRFSIIIEIRLLTCVTLGMIFYHWFSHGDHWGYRAPYYGDQDLW